MSTQGKAHRCCCCPPQLGRAHWRSQLHWAPQLALWQTQGRQQVVLQGEQQKKLWEVEQQGRLALVGGAERGRVGRR